VRRLPAPKWLARHIVHWPRPGWPIENRGEVAVLYFLIFVYMMVRGAEVQPRPHCEEATVRISGVNVVAVS
jgi:hypothetical protein